MPARAGRAGRGTSGRAASRRSPRPGTRRRRAAAGPTRSRWRRSRPQHRCRPRSDRSCRSRARRGRAPAGTPAAVGVESGSGSGADVDRAVDPGHRRDAGGPPIVLGVGAGHARPAADDRQRERPEGDQRRPRSRTCRARVRTRTPWRTRHHRRRAPGTCRGAASRSRARPHDGASCTTGTATHRPTTAAGTSLRRVGSRRSRLTTAARRAPTSRSTADRLTRMPGRIGADPLRSPPMPRRSRPTARLCTAVALTVAIASTGCMTGERPTLGTSPTQAGTESGDPNVDAVLVAARPVGSSAFTAGVHGHAALRRHRDAVVASQDGAAAAR